MSSNSSFLSSGNDCTSSFGGTSAAAPLVAGVVALILEANPNLGWRDVQHIFVNTSRITDEHDADWVTNGGGYHHNHKYGFGLVDAAAATSAAVTHVNLPDLKVAVSHVTSVSKALHDFVAVASAITIHGTLPPLPHPYLPTFISSHSCTNRAYHCGDRGSCFHRPTLISWKFIDHSYIAQWNKGNHSSCISSQPSLLYSPLLFSPHLFHLLMPCFRVFYKRCILTTLSTSMDGHTLL